MQGRTSIGRDLKLWQHMDGTVEAALVTEQRGVVARYVSTVAFPVEEVTSGHRLDVDAEAVLEKDAIYLCLPEGLEHHLLHGAKIIRITDFDTNEEGYDVVHYVDEYVTECGEKETMLKGKILTDLHRLNVVRVEKIGSMDAMGCEGGTIDVSPPV